jgi:hypothetical protein
LEIGDEINTGNVRKAISSKMVAIHSSSDLLGATRNQRDSAAAGLFSRDIQIFTRQEDGVDKDFELLWKALDDSSFLKAMMMHSLCGRLSSKANFTISDAIP